MIINSIKKISNIINIKSYYGLLFWSGENPEKTGYEIINKIEDMGYLVKQACFQGREWTLIGTYITAKEKNIINKEIKDKGQIFKLNSVQSNTLKKVGTFYTSMTIKLFLYEIKKMYTDGITTIMQIDDIRANKKDIYKKLKYCLGQIYNIHYYMFDEMSDEKI